MPAIEDHEFLKLAAQLASCLNISISSARRKIDIVAAKEGSKDIAKRKAIAKKLLKEATIQAKDATSNIAATFDELLAALKEEENFMVED